ncbi:MAG TPA: hypothetical protein PLN56_10520 [Methanoregulaceae archaeon]|nr:hypothetical protein [Methanoregulaceae archaeon]HRU80604.1 hypothetical protein [Methanolinea sp.]
MKTIIDKKNHEGGVSSLIEYLFISSILLIFMAMLLITINPLFLEGPLEHVTRYAYIDIGNGVSTRITDIAMIAPRDGQIRTKYDIPDDIVGRGYSVIINPGPRHTGQDSLTISGDKVSIEIPLSGIGATTGIGGQTTSSGLNEILYDSRGF